MGHYLLRRFRKGRCKRLIYAIICQLFHFAAGCVTAVTAVKHPSLAALLFGAFIIYEVNEDWHLSNSAYKDIFVYALGLYVTAIFLIA